MPIALTKQPSPSIENCELTYLTRERIDLERLNRQHREYGAALEACGLRVMTLPADDLPDSVFVEDAAVILDEVAVMTTFGAASRRLESERIEPEIARRRPIVRMALPATLEGGDVLRIGKTVFVGMSPRTNAAGVEALARLVEPYGYRVVSVPVSGCLHLKTGCTALDDHTLLVNPDWVDVRALEHYERVPVSPHEPWGANVMRAGQALVMNAAFPETLNIVQQRGYSVYPVDITEFGKAEAGLTCLSLVFE